MSIECVKCGPIRPSEGTYDGTCCHCGSRVIREDEPRGKDAVREQLANRVAELEQRLKQAENRGSCLADALDWAHDVVLNNGAREGLRMVSRRADYLRRQAGGHAS